MINDVESCPNQRSSHLNNVADCSDGREILIGSSGGVVVVEGGGLKLGLYGIVWGLYWIIWDYIGLYGIIWDYLGLYGTIWDYMGLYGSSGGRGAKIASL